MSTVTVTFRTTTISVPFKRKGTAICGRKRGRIKTRSELNAIGDEKDTIDTAATNEKARAALEQLDSQLSALAEKNVFKDRDTDYLVSDQEKDFKEAGIGMVDWPEFTPGFLAFAGIGLLLITLVNNVLFNMLVASPSRKRTPPPSISDSSKPRFGYKVESLEAPPLTNKG
ncbi:hypothetical protein KI387_008613 [Taxus chinensis]|uniref:Uncharacterized protein n=1 Tax=Taxus chinensis TaxID=29808 RepID=A0AA38FFE6_TAXCH|nr:hypothetical protein KI387_008613 [Taxus chinensis]